VSSRRTTILVGVLLLTLAGYFSMQLIPSRMTALGGPPGMQPLDGRNSISGLRVEQTAPGVWAAQFDYFYAGAPSNAQLVIKLAPAAGTPSNPLALYATFISAPLRGTHHLSVKLQWPGTPGRTVRVTALMRHQMNGWVDLASQQVDQTIDWPDFQTWTLNQSIATHSPEENLKQAQMMIDSEDGLQTSRARYILEKLLEQNPKFDPAYIELARIAMKTNWGPEGLHQAEDLLATALQIRPDNTDTKILLGYVYAHQGHFTKADALFKQVEAAGTTNLWLWTNWGEMLEIEHQPDQAVVKYRQDIAHPMTHDRNDRARDFAYGKLLGLLRNRKDFDGMEALYKQRLADFGWGSCYSADYTRFLLQIRGNIDGAIDSARRALNQSCDDSPSRELLGLAEYAKWAESREPARTQALNQARIFLPMSARALYLLAASERTATAARQVVAAGEPIDQKDNDNFDALAYALQSRDFDAVRRLMALGARAETPIGPPGIPVAFVPVLDGDVADVRMMRKLGVRYSTLRYRGVTALDIAKRQGNEAMVSALGGGNTTL
jgi:tetratricopeptide repeat protein